MTGSRFTFLSCCMQGLAANGKLMTLTVEDLKLYCAANGPVKGGKKADIIARITDHVNT